MKFLSACPDFKCVISSWNSVTGIGLCSFSCGPALDYLSFISALCEHMALPPFKTTLLSKYGAWRNTVDIVTAMIKKDTLCSYAKLGSFYYKDVKVVQHDFLESAFSGKSSSALQSAHVVLMVKCLNLAAPGSKEEGNIKIRLKDMITILRSEAIVFFVDTKPSLAIFTEILANFLGKFLYNPDHSSYRIPPVSEAYINTYGSTPVVTARGSFFVWQKLGNECSPILNISSPKILQTNNKKEKDVILGNNDPGSVSIKFSPNTSQNALNMSREISAITETLNGLILSNSNNVESHPMTTATNLLQNDKGEDSDTEKDTKTSRCIQNSEYISTKSLSINQFPVEKCENLFDSASHNDSSNLQTKIPTCSDLKVSLPSPSLLGKDCKLGNSSPLCNSNVETNEISAQLKTEKKKLKKKDKSVLNIKSLKPALQSKAVQTDPSTSIEPSSYSDDIKGLTDKVRGLVASYERELELQNCNYQTHHSTHHTCNKSSFNASCSGHDFYCGNNSSPDSKLECCSGHQFERKSTFNNCNFSHCSCANKYRMIHCCGGSHCHESLALRCCHMATQSIPCRNNFSNLAGPNIVIPLQNINGDILTQIVTAIKTNSEPN
ncbi:uncharacterized protein TNCV_2973451 [Trichonephila clavipes]|nr:uncharacterized protein TNCV_2973451 [Trichonephila clavipes]